MRFPGILIFVAIVLVILVCVPLFWAPVVPLSHMTSRLPATTQIGRVVTAGHGGIVLSDAAGIEHSFPVFAEAPVNVNGKQIPLENLPHGIGVRLAVRRDGEVMAVSAVNISTLDTPRPIWPRERW